MVGIRKRRTKTAHPGVKIRKRTLETGREFWFARFVDPDTGKTVDVTLNSVALPTREARRQWAIKKSQSLARRSAELASGAPRKKNTPISQAISDFRRSCETRLRPNSVRAYNLGFSQFQTWAKAAGIETAESITPRNLAVFRDYLIADGKRVVLKGGKRGASKKTKLARSPHTINRELRSVKTMLNQWRRLGLLPLVDKDSITDTLARLETPRLQPVYLTPTKCKKLIDAALRHDSEVFTETREEHAGLKPLGSTAKHDPIAPFALFLLLTGCRLNEALTLQWNDVDLQATDHNGNIIGAVSLRSEVVKTARGRQISLGVCPSLRRLLAALKLRSTPKKHSVFGLRRDQTDDARARLIKSYGAPSFRWKDLRSTCEVYLVNSPAIFGSATIYLAAQQLGHSVEVAQRHYLQATHGISPDVKTLEAAMQIEILSQKIIDTVSRESNRDLFRTKGGRGYAQKKKNGS